MATKNATSARVGRRYPAPAMAPSLGLSHRAIGTDAFANAAARMGFGTPSLAEGADYVLQRFSYDYWLLITLYRNHWISRRIVDGIAADMVRAWPMIAGDIEPKDSDRIDRALRVTRSKQQFQKTLQWARLFGGAGALIVIEGHGDHLDKPLDYDDIEPGAYKGLLPFDRWTGITPEASVCTDISRPLEFNLPEYYQVHSKGGGSFRVHATRLLRFTGPDVPTPEYEAQSWWGISVLEPCYEEIRKRDNMSWNILSLTFRAQVLAMTHKDLAQMLSGAGVNANAMSAFYQRMEAFNQMLSNQSLAILPDGSNFQSVNYTFTGLSDVYQQFQLDIAGASGYPVSRLFGRTITGLGQSNDADERLYEERVALEQENDRPQWEKLYAVVCMSEMGEIPDDLNLKFPSIRVLGDAEKASIATQHAQTLSTLSNIGGIKRPTLMKEIKQLSDITGVGTNITDEDIAQAEKEEDLGFGLPQEGELSSEPKAEGEHQPNVAEVENEGTGVRW